MSRYKNKIAAMNALAPFHPAVREWFAEATDASWGDRDYSAILAWLLR